MFTFLAQGSGKAAMIGINAHLHGTPQIVLNAPGCHDLFHAFKLHLAFSITHDAA